MKRLVGGDGGQTDPFWSPNGSQLIYKSPKGLWIVTSAGVPISKPDFTHHQQDTNPAWAPDDKSVAFASKRSTVSLDIYKRLFSAQGDDPIPLAFTSADEWDPSWSPGSDRIAFARGVGGTKAAVWTMDVNGKNQKQLTTDAGIYDDPAWSHDGTWIAATRRKTKSDPKVLWLMRSDGSNARALTKSGVNEHDPTWSPDGRYLAFSRGDSARQIVVIDLEGHEFATFGRDGASNGFPEWH
jgi:Tol biopolymer transport system component